MSYLNNKKEYRFLFSLILLLIFLPVFSKNTTMTTILLHVPNGIYQQVSALLIHLFAVLFMCDNIFVLVKLENQIKIRVKEKYYKMIVHSTVKVNVILTVVFIITLLLTGELNVVNCIDCILIHGFTSILLILIAEIRKTIHLSRIVIILFFFQLILMLII